MLFCSVFSGTCMVSLSSFSILIQNLVLSYVSSCLSYQIQDWNSGVVPVQMTFSLFDSGLKALELS